MCVYTHIIIHVIKHINILELKRRHSIPILLKKILSKAVGKLTWKNGLLLTSKLYLSLNSLSSPNMSPSALCFIMLELTLQTSSFIRWLPSRSSKKRHKGRPEEGRRNCSFLLLLMFVAAKSLSLASAVFPAPVSFVSPPNILPVPL